MLPNTEYEIRNLKTDDLEQYNALLRYAFQITEQELSMTGWRDDEIKQSKFPILERADVLGCFDGETLVSQIAVYPLKMNVDNRGSFTEIIRTADRGQFSVNISKPGITKGQHWHHTKTKKFVAVSGRGLIQLRKVGTDPATGSAYPVVDYYVSGDEITVVDMIPGYTHRIVNLSKTENLVTVMTCNEIFNPNHPDTFFEPV